MKTDHRSIHPPIHYSFNNADSFYVSDMGPHPLYLEEMINIKLSHQSNVVVLLKGIVMHSILQMVSYDPYSLKIE